MIDWEYAGMQDPHLDIAMFCIYSLYNKEKVDQLISLYFTEGCPDAIRIKIYCYIASAGLLWSNWCEYKDISVLISANIPCVSTDTPKNITALYKTN